MRRLRSGVIGSISAWLPSRRSTAHQRGATVVTVVGQVRSGSSIGVNGVQRWIGIGEGCCGLRTCGCVGVLTSLLLLWARAGHSSGGGGQRRRRGTRGLRGEGADLGEGLAAAGKEQAAAHGATVAAPCAGRRRTPRPPFG